MILVPAPTESLTRHMLPPIVPHLANLDTEIQQILSNSKEAPEAKLLNYNQVLRRYMKLRNEMEQNSFSSGIHDTKPGELESPIQPRDAVQRNRRTTSASEVDHDGSIPFSDDTILEGIPSRNIKSARLLLNLLKRNNDLTWTRKGEMIDQGQRIINTNIIDLVHDFSRHRRTVEPATGAIRLALLLRKQNAPRESIGNPARWNLIIENARLPFELESSLDRSHHTYDESTPVHTSTPYRTWIEARPERHADTPAVLEFD